jgi:starch phosphorylase
MTAKANDLTNSISTIFKQLISHYLRFGTAKPPSQWSHHDWYYITAQAVRDILFERMLATQAQFERMGAKRLYYLSLEYLIGRSLENNLFNLGLVDHCREFLARNGIDLQALFDEEADAGLGNGGLGRLAACMLDSLATLGMPGYGYGINYEFGLFRQQIVDGYQVEQPDSWRMEASPWLKPRLEDICSIPVYGRVEPYTSRDGQPRRLWTDYRVIIGLPSDLPIAGFGGRTVNYVRLFEARASNEFDIQIFNGGDYLKAVEQKMVSETLSKVLYPSDSSQSGRELRLLQEYFFVACAIQDITRSFFARGEDVDDFPARVAIQLNDTHPALAIVELMRRFIDHYDLPWETAWRITQAAVAYTNHTLMPEALERWPVALLQRVLPRHLEIIYEIDRRFLAQALNLQSENVRQEEISLISGEFEPQVRMAHLAIVGSHSINGVSKLHSELLKTRLVPEFSTLWPERFNNKTNGVTQRRWLLMANPRLARLLDETIGEQWRTNLERTRELERFADDSEFQARFASVKRANKERLATVVYRVAGVDLDPASILDVQAKRIHEYKRQLLMVLGIIHEYLALVEDGVSPLVPRTYLLAGKAAPGYWAAKMIVKLINNVAAVINNDPQAQGFIKVVFVPDYRVSLAERIIPAADLSEQISTAGTEASGTGNMKFAMNGALTIGTLDGANIEIRDEVGAENMFIFGLSAPQIGELRPVYNPRSYYDHDPSLRRVLDALSSDRFCPREPGLFKWIPETLLNRDEYFVMADFASYIQTQASVSREYLKPGDWRRKAILNIARIGRFSSDRTAAEYAREIWGLASHRGFGGATRSGQTD